MSDIGPLCHICKIKKPLYTCPKCEIQYCSSVCYKKHSDYCTELFNRENVTQYLEALKPSEKQKERMIEIVQRNNEALEDDDYRTFTENEEMEDLYYKLESMKLRDEDLQNVLSKNMMNEFYRFIQTESVSEYLHPWIPWWDNDSIKPKIEIIGEESELEEEITTTDINKPDVVPVIMKDIPPLATLTKVNPSPLLFYSLLNIIYAYVYTKRIYNGEFETDIKSCVDCILDLSPSLNDSIVYKCTYDSLDYCVNKSFTDDYGSSKEMAISIISDVSKILGKGRLFILALLSDLNELFIKCENEPGISKKLKKKLVLMRKKVLYFLSWSNEISSKQTKKLSEEALTYSSQKLNEASF